MILECLRVLLRKKYKKTKRSQVRPPLAMAIFKKCFQLTAWHPRVSTMKPKFNLKTSGGQIKSLPWVWERWCRGSRCPTRFRRFRQLSEPTTADSFRICFRKSRRRPRPCSGHSFSSRCLLRSHDGLKIGFFKACKIAITMGNWNMAHLRLKEKIIAKF